MNKLVMFYRRLLRQHLLRAGLMLPVAFAATMAVNHLSAGTFSARRVDEGDRTIASKIAGLNLSFEAPAQAQSNSRTHWAAVERAIVEEHNRVRQNPQSYLPVLEAYLASMDRQGNIPNGCGQNCTMLTREGQSAVEEAITFLRRQPAVGPLRVSTGAMQAAQSHAQDQRDGTVGHTGSDGSRPAERLVKFGVDNMGSGENIAYGPETAQAVMLSLIVDDGVSDRGHRTNIFSSSWDEIGVGCGDHASIGSVCVMDYVKAP